MATADDVMAAIDHRGLRPHEVAILLDDMLVDRIDKISVSLLSMPPIDKIRRLIEAGVSADRLIEDVDDYGTP
jgi:hypothetical protein